MGPSEGQRDAAQVQAAAAQHQNDLFNLGAPGVRLALGDFMSDLGTAGQNPASIQALYAGLFDTSNRQFQQAEDTAGASTAQMALQSGYRGATGAVGEQAQNTILQLETARRSNQRSLQQQQVDASISQRDFNLSQILGIGTGMGQQAMGSYNNALGITGTFNNSNPWGSAASGFASGAVTGAMGGSVVPGLGTVAGGLIGGIVGGAAGYFQGGG